MRPPWLQVSTDFLDTGAGDLAVHLYDDVGEDAEARAGWAAIKVIEWVLARCPPAEPPSVHAYVRGPEAARLLARAARYRGDPERLVRGYVAVGLIEQLEDGLRLRGASRYDAMWAKNNPGLAREYMRAHPDWRPARDRAGTGPEPGRETAGPDPEPGRTCADTDPQDPDPDPYKEVPPPPARPRRRKAGGGGEIPTDLWRQMQKARGAERLPAEMRPPQGFNAWEATAHQAGHRDEQLLEGYARNYLPDPSIKTPNHPTSVWIHPDVWPLRVPPPPVAPEAPPRPAWAPPPDALAEAAWGGVLAALAGDGLRYAVTWLEKLVPARLAGDELHLMAEDRFLASWTTDLYEAVIVAAAAQCSLRVLLGVRDDAPTPLRAPAARGAGTG